MAVEITEVRIKLMEESSERLQAFCSITIDNCFVIRDLKIIEGSSGPFVAMPSRKLTAHCPQCGCKNHLRAAYCNQCGTRMKEDRTMKDEDGRAKLYADIAHPINSACREMIQDRVIREFREELERAKLPGYISRYDDFDSEETIAPPHRMAKPSGDSAPEAASSRHEPAAHARFGPPGSDSARPMKSQQQQPAATSPRRGAPDSAKRGRQDSFGAGIFD